MHVRFSLEIISILHTFIHQQFLPFHEIREV